MKPHTKEELIQSLKEIAEEEVTIDLNVKGFNAMCYRLADPEDLYTECDYCKNTITYSSWGKNDILEIVEEISSLGYDVKVAVLCKDCFEKLKTELYPEIGDELVLDEGYIVSMKCRARNFVFYFRTSSSEQYHCALSSNQDHYNAVLAFLKGEKTYSEYCIPHKEKYIMEDIPFIEFMTGLKIDE